MFTGVVLSILILLPTAWQGRLTDPGNPESWPTWYRTLDTWTGGARITWGLDLQGGLHLQYRVDVDRAMSDRVDRYVSQLREQIATDHPDATFTVERVPGALAIDISATGASPGDLIPDETVTSLRLVREPTASGNLRLILDEAYVAETRDYAVEQAIETIRKRIDASGVADPSISRRGDTDIIIQLPGLDESRFDATKDIIARSAQLRFQMVSEESFSFISTLSLPPSADIRMETGVPQADSPDTLYTAFEGIATPAGTELAVQQVESFDPATQSTRVTGYTPILLEVDETELTGEYIADAMVSRDEQFNRPVVSLQFDAQGGRMFGRLTTENVNRQMAIVLDDVVASAPNINEPILGGRAQISMGGGTNNEMAAEAQALAIVLRNGALPAPIEPQFETQVGPSLGADSVRSGSFSLLLSFALVSVFMVIWYRTAGVFSVLALVINVLFLSAALALFGATLTLPGIAGLTLTVGMAVDANVIIFERIREELLLGKTLKAALSAGYDKAMTAVLDANITTAIAGLVLMEYGSGPIRGFAVTLLIGIVSSLITAIYVTRLGFEFLVDGMSVRRLSI
jgi:preprotein translocase subunit SecD